MNCAESQSFNWFSRDMETENMEAMTAVEINSPNDDSFQ